MSKHVHRARAKIAHVEHQIEGLAKRTKALAQVGDVTFADVSAQLAFQRWRLRLLRRMEVSTEPQVRGWLDAALAALTLEERACVAGEMPEDIRPAAYRAIAVAELCMLALGQHPGPPVEVF